MELTSENVHSCFIGCLFNEGYDRIQASKVAVMVQGITLQVGFDPEKLSANKETIKELLSELPDEFMASNGGRGASFLNMCVDKRGMQWGEHRSVEQLAVLGEAAGFLKPCVPREVWGVLPGGMPYYVINCDGWDDISPEGKPS